MTESKKLVCIVCPKECAIDVFLSGKIITFISGNACERGQQYARQETACPSRVLTTTVPIADGVCKRLPVRSSEAVPKHLTSDWIGQVKGLHVSAPVTAGDVLIQDIFDTGTDVVASKSVSRE